MTRDQIVQEARTWLGVPWRHQGRTRLGVDCVGMVAQVGEALGVAFEDRTDYAKEPNDLQFLRHLRKFLTHVSPSDNPFGCVAVMRQSRYPCHVGIFSWKDGSLTVIHARADRRAVVEEPFRSDMGLVETLAFPGLED